MSAPSATSSPHTDESKSFKPVTQQKNGETMSSHHSKGDISNESYSEPFLMCGPDGPRLVENVKFITPKPRRYVSASNGTSLSSHSRIYGSSNNGDALSIACAQHPAGMKCQSLLANFINGCGAIVNHGYHVDNTKASSKEKREKFGAVADQSIAAFAQGSRQTSEEEGGKDDVMSVTRIAANAKKILHAGNNIMSSLPKDFQNLTTSAAYHNVFDTFQKYAPTPSSVQSEDVGGIRAALSDDPDEVEAAKEPKKTPVSPIIAQRQHFKELRRRRNRTPTQMSSPTRKTTGQAPDPDALSPASSQGSFKDRYSRNIHTKLFTKKVENATGVVDKREPEEDHKGRDPTGFSGPTSSKDEDEDSWATPLSQEDKQNEENAASVEKDPPAIPESTQPKENMNAELEFPAEKSPGANSPEEILVESVTEEVVLSTSSGMSDSLVGSDVGDDEPQQLDSLINSHSEDDRAEFVEGEEDEGDDNEHLILDSYDHSDFPHTPLDVIEEETEDDTTVKSGYSKQRSIDGSMDENQVLPSPSDEMSIDEIMDVKGRYMFSVIGILRVLFVSMVILQCGTIVALWDEIADQIRAVEGGSDALNAAEEVVTNLKSSGVSLISAAHGVINVEKIDQSVGDIYSEIELRTTALIGKANQYVAKLAASDLIQGLLQVEQGNIDEATQEEQLFRKLVDQAFESDDEMADEDIWSHDEDIVSTTDSVEVHLKETSEDVSEIE